MGLSPTYVKLAVRLCSVLPRRLTNQIRGYSRIMLEFKIYCMSYIYSRVIGNIVENDILSIYFVIVGLILIYWFIVYDPFPQILPVLRQVLWTPSENTGKCSGKQTFIKWRRWHRNAHCNTGFTCSNLCSRFCESIHILSQWYCIIYVLRTEY